MTENEGAQSHGEQQTTDVQTTPSHGDDARARALAALERMAVDEGEQTDAVAEPEEAEQAEASEEEGTEQAEEPETKEESEEEADEPSTEEWSKLRHRERVYARQKRELAEMREKVEADRAEIEALKENFAKLKDPANALAAMESLGVSYNDLTAAMLGEDAPAQQEQKTDPAIARLEAELKALREESETAKKAAEEAEQQRKVTHAVNQITGKLSKDDSDRWYYLKAQDNHATEVYDYLVAHVAQLKENGRPLPKRTDDEWVEFAADKLEEYLEKDFSRKYGRNLKKSSTPKSEAADSTTSDSEPAPSLRASGDSPASLDRSSDLGSRKARALRAAQGLPTD